MTFWHATLLLPTAQFLVQFYEVLSVDWVIMEDLGLDSYYHLYRLTLDLRSIFTVVPQGFI